MALDGGSMEYKSILSPSMALRAFVTRIWEHPLVDIETRRHRLEAKTKLISVIEANSFNPEKFVTVPVGSIVWNTNENSDYDYLVCASSRLDAIWLDNKCSGYREPLHTDLENENIQLIDKVQYAGHKNKPMDFVNLLFTPDEYLGGNIEIAKKIRLECIEYMELENWSETEWRENISKRFEIFFSKWDDVSSKDVLKYKGNKYGDNSRDQRIKKVLQKRAEESRAPRKYIEAFNKVRGEMTIPTMKSYVDAIRATNGSLNLSDQYRAKWADIPS